MDHGTAPPPGDVSCSPTWAQPSADGKTVWVACNKTNDIVELDVANWSMRRRIPAGDGIYNLAASRDGKLLVGTNKRGQSVSIIDAVSGQELARVPTTRRVPSGLVISPDSRYAFVTLEGVGSEPGTVDIIDLRARCARHERRCWAAGGRHRLLEVALSDGGRAKASRTASLRKCTPC